MWSVGLLIASLLGCGVVTTADGAAGSSGTSQTKNGVVTVTLT
jgi:hypothetical protein